MRQQKVKAVASGLMTAAMIFVLPLWLWGWSLGVWRDAYGQYGTWLAAHTDAWINTALLSSLAICQYGVWRATRGFSTGARIFAGVAMFLLPLPVYGILLFATSLGMNGVMP